MIKIDFEFTTKYGVFRDALHVMENENFSESEIDAMKNERLNNWIYNIENPPETSFIPMIDIEANANGG